MNKLYFCCAPLLLLMPATTLAQHGGPATTNQSFKNITQLKDVPADQLMPAMQFMSAALGVECSFCHVQGKMDADDKPEKKTAREMIAMTSMINKTSFGGRQQVTCYSCHHGAGHPASVPPVLDTDAPMHSETRPTAPAGTTPPTADDILAKYVASLGGADAMHKTTTRVLTGKVIAGGGETPIDVYTKAPNKRVSVSHASSGDSFTAFDGTAGWMGNTGRPAREMSPSESAASGFDSEFYLGLRLKEMYPQLRRGRPEMINGTECETLIGNAPGRPSVRLYFDSKSGVLVRTVRYTDTPVGRNPTQIDYSDYREVNGVKTPFRWTLSRPNGRFTIQIADAKANVPIEDSRFAKPAAETK